MGLNASSKKKGGGASVLQIQPSQMPDLYDPNKTIRHIYDCNAGATLVQLKCCKLLRFKALGTLEL